MKKPFETQTRLLSFKFDPEFVSQIRKFSLVTGILLILVGIAGAILPQIMSLVVDAFLGWIFVIGGILAGYLAILGRGRSMIAYLKPVLLLIIGALFIFYPLAGVATLALLLTVYLLLDAFGGFGLAYDLYPMRGWGWMAFNGLMSFVLALVLFIGWPVSSPVMLGLYVGISLIFDGLTLVFIGIAAGKTRPE